MAQIDSLQSALHLSSIGTAGAAAANSGNKSAKTEKPVAKKSRFASMVEQKVEQKGHRRIYIIFVILIIFVATLYHP